MICFKKLVSTGVYILCTYLWPLFLNDINYVICEVSLNDDLILPCYWGTAGEFLSKKSLCFFVINFKCCKATHSCHVFLLRSGNFGYCDLLWYCLLLLFYLTSSPFIKKELTSTASFSTIVNIQYCFTLCSSSFSKYKSHRLFTQQHSPISTYYLPRTAQRPEGAQITRIQFPPSRNS